MHPPQSLKWSSAAYQCVAALSLLPIHTAVTAHAQTVVQPDFSEVTRLCEDAVAGRNIGSAVPGFEMTLLLRGQLVYQRSFGAWFQNRVCQCDSATKTLSGALILSLCDSSPVPFSLDSRLSDFIPQFNGEKQTISIRQCFSHTAGFRFSTALNNTDLSLQQVALQIASRPLQYPPGSTFDYGGVSMHAAGAAAELAGQQSWNTLFQQRIANPLGFTVTNYSLTTPSNPRIAGGAESNAREFGRFTEMLRRGGLHATPSGDVRVLSQASVNQMFTRQPALGIPIANSPLEGSSDYGVGVWLDQRDASGQLIGAIAAGARGFSSWIDFDDQYVGTLSTDLSASGNVIPWLSQVRSAAERAIRQAPCAPLDFNRDGNIDPTDVDAYFSVLGEGPCLPATASCDDLDFNNDGEISPLDMDAYFSVLGEGPCLR